MRTIYINVYVDCHLLHLKFLNIYSNEQKNGPKREGIVAWHIKISMDYDHVKPMITFLRGIPVIKFMSCIRQIYSSYVVLETFSKDIYDIFK